MNLDDLETAIKAKLDTISSLAFVYDVYKVGTDGFPYATFELTSFGGEYFDSCTNKRNYVFGIAIFQEITDTRTREDAKRIIYNILDELITAFDLDSDLGDPLIVKGNVTTGELGTFVENGSKLVATVELNLEVLTNAG